MSTESDTSRQLDEIEALLYLLPENTFIPLPTTILPFQFDIKFVDDQFNADDPQYSPLLLHFTFPPTYPTSDPPEINFNYQLLPLKLRPEMTTIASWISTADQMTYRNRLREMWKSNDHAEIVFDFYQYLLTHLVFPLCPDEFRNNSDNGDTNTSLSQIYPVQSATTLDSINTTIPMSKKQYSLEEKQIYLDTRPSDASSESLEPGMSWPQNTHQRVLTSRGYKHPPICFPKGETYKILIERYRFCSIPRFTASKSIFYTDCCPISSVQDVVEILTLLYNIKQYSSATHLMFAYQIINPTTKIVVDHGVDEDGEKGAGSVIMEVLNKYNASVLVLCTREYGGIMLGSDRFRIIASLIQQVLNHAGYHRYKE